MTPKEQQLNQEIERIWKILIIAKECFQYSFYLHKPATSQEAEYLSHSQHFDFIRHILWRMTIIELSKLFSDSKKRDRFNLGHFIGKLKKEGHFSKSGITEAVINKWERELVEKKKIITVVLTLRDKIYAHTDSNEHDYNTIEITFLEVEELIKIVESVVKEIYLTVFDADTDMSTPTFDWNMFDIIKILAEEKRKEIEAILGPRFKIKK